MRRGKWIALALLISAGLLLYLTADSQRLSLFVGRFHALLIHFPIVLILLVALIEVIRNESEEESWTRVLSLLLPLSAAAAFVAVGTGYLLSFEGGFSSNALYWHLRFGFFVAASITLAWILWVTSGITNGRNGGRIFRTFLLLSVLGVVATGHFGGVLAHGSNYLSQYLPAPLLRLWNDQTSPNQSSLATRQIYPELVEPILQKNCISCHSQAKSEGGLILESLEGIRKGSERGEILVPGEPMESEILRRISLPPGHPDRMPPEGHEPVSIGDIELLRWWIQLGASGDQAILSAEERPFTVETILKRKYGPLPEPRRGIFALEMEPPGESALASLREAGFEALPLAEGISFLQVDLEEEREFGSQQVEALRQAGKQVGWLDLSGVEFAPGAAQVLEELPNLVRLNFSRSNLQDGDLQYVSGHAYLEYLNLFDCPIGDEGLNRLEDLPALQAVYLWQTRVTAEGVKTFRATHSDVKVNLGSDLDLQSPEIAQADTEEEAS